MTPKLRFFSDPTRLGDIQRSILTPLLEHMSRFLPPDGAALLKADLYVDAYCAAWAAQFSRTECLGQPLLQALLDIEALADPENRALFDQTMAPIPSNYIDPDRPPLHRAAHLWLIAQTHPEFTFPAVPTLQPVQPVTGLPVPPPASSIENPVSSIQNPVSSIEPAPPESDNSPLQTDGCGNGLQSKIENQKSKIPDPEAQAFSRLAALTPAEYDRVRRAEAKRLGLRLQTLDESVERVQLIQAEAEVNTLHFPEVEPWPEPLTNAPALFDEIHDRANSHFYLPAGGASILALWPGHAHSLAAFTHSPRLSLTSDEPGCGKTSILLFLAALTPKPLVTCDLKPAVLYRSVQRYHPSVYLDEWDTYLNLHPSLSGLLNAGTNLGGTVHRCEGPHIRFFDAFAATALAGLGSLAPTVRDRSILIPLAKAPPDSIKVRFDRLNTSAEAILCQKLARWTKDNFAALRACKPVMPPAAYNRLGDNWRPLFALAQVIGAHWPQRITEAFHHLRPVKPSNHHSANGTQSHASDVALLLADLRQVFAAAHTDRLFSSDLVCALQALPDRPWSGANNGDKPLTEIRLARLLSRSGIRPRSLRIGPHLSRGYLLADFTSAVTDSLPPDYEI